MISLIRIIKFSLQDIVRNIWLSIVTIVILVLALFSVNILTALDLISKATIGAIKERVDINIHVTSQAEEDEIMALKAKISNFSQTGNVRYVSRAEALANFRAKHKDNPEILEALRELGRNPLSASLVIKPKEANNYKELIKDLNELESDIIESRNFDDHELILNKINAISEKVNKAGIAVSSVFIFVTALMVFYSIRIAIYTHRTEIAIMRLVGASHWFIRAPYLFSGIIYAFIGLLIVIIGFYPFLSILQPYLETFFLGYNINVFTYFIENFFQIFGIQFLGTSLINILASLMAVRKYSKV